MGQVADQHVVFDQTTNTKHTKSSWRSF